MSITLINAINNLRKKLLRLGTRVEKHVANSITAFKEMDPEMASNVIAYDKKIDLIEVDIESDCVEIFALYQPVAVDLRFVYSAVKINKDLERIGDLGVKIAYQAWDLAHLEQLDIELDFDPLILQVQTILSRSLATLATMDVAEASLICKLDDIVDWETKLLQSCIQQTLVDHREWAGQLLHLLKITYGLERIADLAENIAEEIIYIEEGILVRHAPELRNNLISFKGEKNT